MKINKQHLTESEIAKYVDAFRRKSEADMDDYIIEHIEECTQCKKTVLEILDIVEELKQEDLSIQSKISKKPKRYKTFFKYAAAIVILFPLAYNLINSINHNSKENNKLTSGNSVNKTDSVSSNMIAMNSDAEANYNEIPEYEAICGDTFRSVNINVKLPQINQSSKGEIIFDLSMNYITKRYLKIFNNKDQLIHTEDIPQIKFREALKFNPGLYYWKIETESELEYLGKFVIRN